MLEYLAVPKIVICALILASLGGASCTRASRIQEGPTLIGQRGVQYCALRLELHPSLNRSVRQPQLSRALRRLDAENQAYDVYYVNVMDFSVVMISRPVGCGNAFSLEDIEKVEKAFLSEGIPVISSVRLVPNVVYAGEASTLGGAFEMLNQGESIHTCAFALEFPVHRWGPAVYQEFREVAERSMLRWGMPILHAEQFDDAFRLILHRDCDAKSEVAQILVDDIVSDTEIAREEFTLRSLDRSTVDQMASVVINE